MGLDEAETIGAEAVRQIPRVLGMIDRDPSSRTYGCADRYYWHYKLHDFSNARFQETSELLAVAYHYPHPQNPYYLQDCIREWAIAAIRYWERIIRGDGSFDEAYPYERSFCATSFSAMHVTEAMIRLSIRPSSDLGVVGCWLAVHESPDTANQNGASAAALANIGKLMGNEAYGSAARRRVEGMRADHNRLGYFNEYGGPDLGYSSITLSALSIYADRTNDEGMSAWIATIADQTGRSLKEDGRYDYQGQSRGTRFFYPYSLAWLKSPHLGKLAFGVAADKILKPSWMDDRYLVPYAADYLRSAVRLSSAAVLAPSE